MAAAVLETAGFEALVSVTAPAMADAAAANLARARAGPVAAVGVRVCGPAEATGSGIRER